MRKFLVNVAWFSLALLLGVSVWYTAKVGIEDHNRHTQDAENIEEFSIHYIVETDEEVFLDEVLVGHSPITFYDLIKDDERYTIDDGMIISVDGVENDYAGGHYWMIYQDGVYAPVGMCELVLDKDVDITLKYEVPVW